MVPELDIRNTVLITNNFHLAPNAADKMENIRRGALNILLAKNAPNVEVREIIFQLVPNTNLVPSQSLVRSVVVKTDLIIKLVLNIKKIKNVLNVVQFFQIIRNRARIII